MVGGEGGGGMFMMTKNVVRKLSNEPNIVIFEKSSCIIKPRVLFSNWNRYSENEKANPKPQYNCKGVTIMAREKLTGIYIPVVTPFNEDESINFESIDEISKFLAENGVDGIIPSGSTGEMIAMTKEEQIAVNKAYITAGHKYGIKVVASTGAYRTCDVVEMSKAAEADGADGVMVVTPWYMGPNKQELYDHYKTIHESINIPVMMYHNPYYSTVLLDDRFIAKMYNEGCIDAIKERQADVFRQQNLRRLTDENFAIFYGYDVCAVETQSTWSDGWVVGTGNLFPKENSTVYKLAKAGKLEEAKKAQEELVWPYLPLFTEADSNGDVLWLQMIKIGLKMRGVNAGYCCKPVINDLPEEDMERLKAALKHYNYI